MKALYLKSVGAFEMRNAPEPVPGPEDVLFRISTCAVCRTDAKMWKQGHRDLRLPRIPGHEICGRREDSGERFTVWPGTACGVCGPCLGGKENLCADMRVIGFHRDGGFAEMAAVPEKSLIPVPENLSDEIASLSEPLACTLNALDQAGFEKGMQVLIYGGGPVGLLAGLAVRALNGTPVISEINSERVDATAEFRETAGILTSEAFTSEADIVINAAPSSQTFSDGLPRLRSGGVFCLFSGLTDGGTFPASLMNEIHYRQLYVTGAYGCTRHQMERAVKLLTEQKKAARLLIAERISLDSVPDSISEILAGRGMKSVIRFD